jgi:hypothetical protein
MRRCWSRQLRFSKKAHATRVEHKFDRVFMTSLSFENDQATAVFSCRGADL